MPKLPRTWVRVDGLVFSTASDALFLYTGLNAGETVERLRFNYRIMGRTNESELLDWWQPWYVGLCVVPTTTDPADLDAYTQRNAVDWMWWEAAYMRPHSRTATPGQVDLLYPGEDYERDCRSKRIVQDLVGESLVFSFSNAGGSALTDMTVNVTVSMLVLG